MKFRLLFLAILLASFVANAQQNLSDYSFVVIPEQFDFVKEKNKYELNAMTQFYFEKYGFNAFLANKVPNVQRCDGLYADVVEEPTILGTRIIITLKDCSNNIVYTSKTGKSKIKEYKMAYQDALREAFISVGALGVNQKDVKLYKEVAIENNKTTEPVRTAKIDSKDVTNPTSISVEKTTNNSEVIVVRNIELGKLPESKFSNYRLGDATFLLRKTGEGYALYKETEVAEDGLLLEGKIVNINNTLHFINLKGESYTASFDASLNLIIDYPETKAFYQAIN